jgi:hypothetical protein
LAESSGWPGELARQYAGELELLTAPRAAPRLLELTPEVQAQLQAIGYGE